MDVPVPQPTPIPQNCMEDEMSDPTPLGIRVRELRKARKMSAQKLSDAIGGIASRDVIANLENGRRDTLTVHQAAAIAKVFEISIEALIDESISIPALTLAHEIAAIQAQLADAEARLSRELSNDR